MSKFSLIDRVLHQHRQQRLLFLTEERKASKPGASLYTIMTFIRNSCHIHVMTCTFLQQLGCPGTVVANDIRRQAATLRNILVHVLVNEITRAVTSRDCPNLTLVPNAHEADQICEICDDVEGQLLRHQIFSCSGDKIGRRWLDIG